MNSKGIIKLTVFLTKKRNFTFLNFSCFLLVAGLVFAPFTMRYTLDVKNKSSKPLSTSSVYHDLSYIKPFTSLVGFNWKFNKENKRKTKETKSIVFSIALKTFKTSF